MTMKNRLAGAALAVMLLSSCGSGSKRQNTNAASTGAEPANSDHAGNETGSIDPIDEMSRIQTETEDVMEAARGRDMSDAWARKMIEHQKGAVRFSQLLLRNSRNQRLRDFAASTIVQAGSNIRALQAATENSLFKGEDLDAFVRPQLDMFGAMTISNAKTFEQTWTAKMIAFHRGAVRLAGVAINAGDEGHAKELARQMAVQQANDADALERTSKPRNAFLGKRPR